MTRDEARKAAKVLLHYADGGEVESCFNYGKGLWTYTTEPLFYFETHNYRIRQHQWKRPEQIDDKVWVRDCENYQWIPRFYAGAGYAWAAGKSSFTSEGSKTAWPMIVLANNGDMPPPMDFVPDWAGGEE